MSEATKPRTNGRDRLLDAAEALFSDKGYFGASMREITQAAGVPLGLANYHFGSKDELYKQVMLRRAPEMSAILNESLDQTLARGGELRDIFYAYAAPHLNLRTDAGWRNYIRLAALSSLQAHRSDLMTSAAEAYAPVMARFHDALCKASPKTRGARLNQIFYIFRMSVLAIAADTSETRGGACAMEAEEAGLWELVASLAAKGCSDI